MESKEEILKRAVMVGDALDRYARQQAIAFLKYAEVNSVRCGEDEWQTRENNFRQTVTSQHLYELFLSQLNKEP